MGRHHFAISRVSSAPPERVFALLADGANWAAWGGPFAPRSRWEVEATPPGSVGAVRALGRPPLMGTLEEVVEHEAPRRHAYRIVAGIPTKTYLGVVDLTALPDGGTRIDWQAQFRPVVPGTGAAIGAFSRLVVSSLAEHLARAAEEPA